MELWVRSQDKYTLMKIEEIQICENPDGTWFMNAGLVLGKYETKERALEVLDEIQNILNPQKKLVEFYHENFNNIKEGIVGITAYKEDNIKTEQFSTFVYEMPKE